MSGLQPAAFPIFRIMVAYSLGIMAGIAWFPQNFYTPILGLLIMLALALAIYLIFYQRSGFLKAWFMAPLLIYPLFFLLGIFLCLNADPRTRSDYFARRPALNLIISADEPGYSHGKAIRFRAQVLDCIYAQGTISPASGYLMMTIRDTNLSIHAGRRYLIPARYREIPAPLNPAGFNYQQYEAIHQVFHQCSLEKEDLHYLQGHDAESLSSLAFKIQDWAAGLLEKNIHGQGAFSFLSAMVTGQRTGLPAMLYQSFSRTGTVHIISISGMHVHIVFTLLGWLVGTFKRSRYSFLRIFRKVFLISLIWFYALISGLSPAVCRCALMIMLMICTEQLSFKVAGPLMLSLSAFLLLLIQPWLLADMGFQLSYLAVAGLHAFQSPLNSMIKFHHPVLRAFWNLSSTSIAAQIFTFPLCLWYFHQFPVCFLFANLVIIPLTGLMLYLGMAMLGLAWIPFTGHLISFIYEYLFKWMSRILDFFSGLPGSVIENIYPDLLSMILLAFMIFGYHRWLTLKNRSGLFTLLLSTAFILAQNMANDLDLRSQRKILFLSIPKKAGICLVEGRKGYIYETATLEKNLYQAVYKPALASMGVRSVYWIRGAFSQPDLRTGENEINFHDWKIIIKQGQGADMQGSTKGPSHLLVYTQNNYIWNDAQTGLRHPFMVITGNRNSISCILKNKDLCAERGISCRSLRLQGACLITMDRPL